MPKVVEEKGKVKKDKKEMNNSSKVTPKEGKAIEKKVAESKAKKSAKSKTTSKKTVKSAKFTTKKLSEKTIEKKKNDKVKKANNSKDIKNKTTEKKYLTEYYDLPYRYDETIVTILAQTPKRLFVYWDVSEKDKAKYRKAFGEDFFEKTYPILLVHNEELNYTFEIPINDFANSWYLDIQDSKTKYVVQLGRKFRNIEQAHNVNYEEVRNQNINLQNDFIYITDSNKLEAPNDHVLFEKLRKQVKYRNLKTGAEFDKKISSILSKIEEVYPDVGIEGLYKELYGDEFEKERFSISNPGSGSMPTSGVFRK